VFGAGFAAVRAQEAKEIAEKLAAIRDAAADRDLPRVERLVGEFDAARPGLDALDEARLLLGKTELGAGRAEEAAKAVEAVVDRAASPWSVKALYLTAEASAARRGWKEAADVYAKRVEWASSDLHRAELAALYREIADGAFEGDTVADEFGRERKVPDWAAARKYYAKSRDVFVADKDRALVSYRIGKAALESGDPAGAAAEWTELLRGNAGEWADDATYGLGQANAAMGRMAEARAFYEKVRADFGDSSFAPLALIRIGETWQPVQTRSDEELRRVVEAWTEFVKLYPSHAEAAATSWRTAETLFQFGRARESVDAYRAFLAAWPQDDRAAVAQDRIASAFLSLGEFDQAVKEWQTLLAKYPNHPLWAAAQKNVANASFQKGRVAFDEKRDADALAALTAFLAAFPVDPQAPQAQLLLGDLASRAGKHADAVEAWKLVTTKYADSPAAPAAALRIAAAWEGPLADLEKALAAYEDVANRWPGSSEASQARDVMAQMKAKTLVVTVERPFRTDEKPVAAMRLRNVKSLRMKAYRVRPDEYLARRGGLAGVEQVEVDIVKPDFAWDFAPPDFAKYRLLERTCELPFAKPGAYIVTAAEEDLTATFLVVVSDLTAIVKSAPGQALVFVWDERTGQPVPGAEVRLLDSDARGVTGADGVWQADRDGLSRVRAIVIGAGDRAGQFAFADGTAGAQTSFGYATKVFLQTDRPLYRPGQDVHLRAIVRRVSGGRYVTEKGLGVAVRVVDPRGAVLFDKKLETDEFGVISGGVELAPEPALGAYQVIADLDGRTFTQAFDVLAYRKPDVLADVTPEKRTYLVGDTVKADVALRFAVGGNVAGAAVKWTAFRGPFTFDPSVHESFSWFFRDAARDEEARRRAEAGTQPYTRGEGTTDAQGKLAISFATETVEEDRTYTIVVEAQDPNRRWITTSCAVPVTRQGAFAVTRTEKKVYRPGEMVRLEVTTVDPMHLPLPMDGRAVLVRRRIEAQHQVEDEVASVAAKTDAAGRAIVELKADKPGEYVARFQAKDQRGRLVEGGSVVTLAGDAEDLAKQAKLVADREFYKEGDTAKVLVNVPVAPCPVLFTYEGEKVLGYRIVMAAERSTTIDVPLAVEHSPNVFLRMAAAKGGRLYEDGDEVAVFQYLDVKVAARPGEVKPGGKVTIDVTATDQSGRPVRAEVGVDVVDAAIYQLAFDGTPQVKPFFYDQRRTHAVATAASVAALPAVTRPTNKDLLFEQMRRLGKEQFAKMQEHVRLGRELMEKGERDRAREEFAKAIEIAPGNYEARALLDSLDEVARQEQEARKRPAPPASPAPPPELLARFKKEKGPLSGAEKDDEAEIVDRSSITSGVGGGSGSPTTGAGKLGHRGTGKPSAFDGRHRAAGGERDADKKYGVEDAADPAAGFPGDEVSLDSPTFVSSEGLYASSWVAVQRNRKAVLTFTFAGGSSADDGFLKTIAFAQADAPVFVPAELRQNFADTAFSSPSVRTGDDGAATVTVDLPDNLTEWRVTARGASAGPLVGEGRASFRTVKRILVRPDAPRFLTQGDTATATASVHSSLETETDLTVRFAPDNLRATGDAERRDKIGPGAVKEYEIVLVGDAHGLAKVRAEALTPVESDAVVEALPVVPYGLRRVDGASGLLVDEAFAKLELPEGAADGTTSLTVTLSPSIDVALLESLAYTSTYPWGCVEQTVNRFLPALAARNALTSSGSPNERLKKLVDATVDRGIAALCSLQNDDGSFGWFGRRGAAGEERAAGGDPEMTAYAVLGFVRAEQAGYHVSRPNRDRAVAAAEQLVRAARPEDRAFLLYALSFAGRADLESLNAMFRERATLSPRALALVALTMQRTGRPSNALEAARMLAGTAVRVNGTAHWDADGAADRSAAYAWPVRDAEPTAYAMLALLAADPTSPLIDEAAAWLTASRRGPAWRSTRDTAAAIEALAEHAKSRGVERAACDVDVFVNDGEKPAATVAVGGPGKRPVDAPSTVEVPASALRTGANKIVLRRRGQGRVHWSATLATVVRPAEGKTIEAGGRMMSVDRDYTAWFSPPLPGEAPEERIAPGYGVVVPEKRPAGWHGRPLAVAGTGDKVRVTLRVRSPQRVERVIVEDALPAGFEVVQSSAEGPFDREERRDDRQAFFFAAVQGETTVSYVLQAIHPGEYRVLPALARPMYEPEIHAWSAENRLAVRPEPGLAGRMPSAEEITPDEVWGLALRDFSRRDWARARSAFEGLLAKYELRPDVQEEAYARLFAVGVETDDAALTVKSHEQLVDRNPRRAAAALRERRKLAAAYQSLGENERALALLRDVVRELSVADDEAAQAFQEIGNPWRGLALADAGFLAKPDAGWEEAQELAVARAYTALRAPGAAADAKHRVPRTSDAMPLLLGESARRLRAFQAHHAGSALADEAGYTEVQTLLAMKLPADVIAEGTKFVARYPKSRWLDDVTFLVAEGHFEAGEYDAALAAAKPLYERKFPKDDDPRVLDWSPFRANAVHLTAKVAHLRGDLPRAVDLYRQVENLFPDARDAREFLTKEGLELRDVERAAVGATPVLHLRRKNVAEVRLRVYAVDFMILYALRRDLSGVNRIDLAGVEPVKEWVVAKKGAEDFRWHDETVELPGKDKGVYLVVAKGGGLDASSVVLVSDLDVDVQESGGRVRVYATDRATGAPAGDVYVKIGAGSAIQAQGFTDPRGVFEAGGVSGSFSVVAEKDGNVALWRK
jgi:uncharacterized protein YfaS (alpha-2-macroglobulin family)/TolA-binding protein